MDARASVPIEQHLARMEEAVRVRDEAIAVVSHDLRNFLNVLGLNVHRLTKTAPEIASAKSTRPQIESIRRTCAHMERIIRDLFDAGSIDRGDLRLDVRPISAQALLLEASELLEPLVAEQKIRFELSPAAGKDETIRCDRQRALQVFSNLVSNSVKFTAAGGQIRLGFGRSDGQACFRVDDTGEGISPEFLPRVFERYWKAPNSHKGSGLGLFIVHGIVVAHGGRVWVESTPGVGSSFSFTLPLAN
jgi:signal transduction histidine kinase